MAVDNPVGINDPTGAYVYNAATFRRFLSATLVHDADALSARPGVLHGLTGSASGLTVTMSTGTAVVTPQSGTNGSYVVSASSTTALTLDARDATYTRRDLISLQVLDPEVSGSTRAGQFVVTKGTPAASPVTPSGPAGSLPLCYASVPPGTASVAVVDVRPFTASLGGTIPCTSTTRPSGSWLRPGQTIMETDTGVLFVWTGSAWVAASARTGWTSLALSSGVSGTVEYKIGADMGEVRFDVTGSWSGDVQLTTGSIPAAYRPSGPSVRAGEAYYDPQSSSPGATVYMSMGSGQLRAAAMGGTVTRIRGDVQWML